MLILNLFGTKEFSKINRYAVCPPPTLQANITLKLHLNNATLAYYWLEEKWIKYLEVKTLDVGATDFYYNPKTKWIMILRYISFSIEGVKVSMIENKNAEDTIISHLELYNQK